MSFTIHQHIAFLSFMFCFSLAQAQESVNSNVDWTSSQSVLAHIEYLLSQNMTTEAISRYVYTNSLVTADGLWTNCLNFSVITNEYAAGARQIRIKEKTLLTITQMDSFSFNAQNRRAAVLMMDQIRSIQNINTGKPLPFPGRRLYREDISTNDSPAEIERKTMMNTVYESNYVARVAAYRQDQDKRLFYKSLQSLNFFLTVYIRGVHDD